MSRKFEFLPAFAPLFYEEKPYFIITSGRAAGKSTQAAAFCIIKLMEDSYNRIVISRYTQRSIKTSILRDILDLIDQWGLRPFLKIDGDEITNLSNGNLIMTHAMRVGDGAMVGKGKGIANANILIIDEAQELPSEEEFIKLNDSFRMKGAERKIVMLLNPTTTRHWIHRKWFIDGQPNPKWFDDYHFMHLTYHQNKHNLDLKKIEEWERMKWIDPEYYSHHVMGEWNEGLLGRIFKDWSFEYDPDPEAQLSYALDFGFTNDPTAMIEIRKRGNKIWLKELLYETGLTNADISILMEKAGIKKTSLIIADSAEPKSIEELRRLGWRNISGAYKGPDSIRNGISTMKSFQIHVDPKSTNLIDEYNLYSWDKTGERPEDQNNHLMDAIRYGLNKQGGNGSYGFYSAAHSKTPLDPDLPKEQKTKSQYGYK
jgi:phage terminase large subunit